MLRAPYAFVIIDITCNGYIKIDVEGHEVKVLKGAEKIIRNQHPVMAVSMYHKKSADNATLKSSILGYAFNFSRHTL